MKKTSIILSIISLCVIAVIISAYIIMQYSFSPKSIDKNAIDSESVEIYHPTVTVEPETPVSAPVQIYYLLTAENNELILYEINGDNKKIVKSTSITPEIFPKGDVALLKSGIQAFSLEEGIEIMENFIS